MNEQRIREIANQSSTYAENSVDYYSGIVDGLTWEAKILKVRDLKFAELIVEECARIARATPAPNFHEHLKQQLGHTWDMAASEAGREIVKHFGVKE